MLDSRLHHGAAISALLLLFLLLPVELQCLVGLCSPTSEAGGGWMLAQNLLVGGGKVGKASCPQELPMEKQLKTFPVQIRGDAGMRHMRRR